VASVSNRENASPFILAVTSAAVARPVLRVARSNSTRLSNHHRPHFTQQSDETSDLRPRALDPKSVQFSRTPDEQSPAYRCS
jgi:hypothetical protein